MAQLNNMFIASKFLRLGCYFFVLKNKIAGSCFVFCVCLFCVLFVFALAYIIKKLPSLCYIFTL